MLLMLRYKNILKDHETSDRYIEGEMQTLNLMQKQKEVQCDPLVVQAKDTQANVWSIYDAFAEDELAGEVCLGVPTVLGLWKALASQRIQQHSDAPRAKDRLIACCPHNFPQDQDDAAVVAATALNSTQLAAMSGHATRVEGARSMAGTINGSAGGSQM